MSQSAPAEIVAQVNKVLHEGLEIPMAKLRPEATLFDDLGLDSLDSIDMLVYLEENFGVKVDAEIFKEVRTVGDIYREVGMLAKTKPDA